MIAILRSFEFLRNSPCQYQRKFVERSVGNMDTDEKGLMNHLSLLKCKLHSYTLHE